MNQAEKEITQLEAEFPAMSGKAFSDARKEALSAGLSVYQAEAGFIYEVFPDGKRHIVKEIEPPHVITVSQTATWNIH